LSRSALRCGRQRCPAICPASSGLGAALDPDSTCRALPAATERPSGVLAAAHRALVAQDCILATALPAASCTVMIIVSPVQ
jgi:hypothetical protein